MTLASFRPRRLLGLRLAAVALAALATGASAQQPPPRQAQPAQAEPQPAQIDRNGVLILLRSTLLALHHANVTGNYTVLRDLGAPGFQAANTAARLAEIFASQRAQNLDLSGVAVLEPQLTVLPRIEANGMMRMAGFYPSVPLQVNFELLFAPVEGRWKLFGLGLNVGQASPAAPQPPPQAEAPRPEAAKPEEKPAAAQPAARPKAAPRPRPPAPAQPQAEP